ncbi:MAG: HAD-IB family hydrolase [Rhodoferax sp.]|nr:HAD-IB family hydrolase [Rhodoferax sp.]
MSSVRPPERARSAEIAHGKPRIVFFDLDHTLLHGDSDVLWCAFLIDKGVLERAEFERRNADIEARYNAGRVEAAEFANFYLSTLAGRTPAHWAALRLEFLRTQILPNVPQAARDLVRRRQEAGDTVVMTTATSRFLAELTAQNLGFEHLIATEPELLDGVFTGFATGVLNMRAGKVTRLHDWLAARGEQLAEFDSTAYSDSLNDLPLLEAVNHPVTVNADAKLAAIAAGRGWDCLLL